MRRMQLDSQEGVATGWSGVSDARNMPERTGKNATGASPRSGDNADTNVLQRGWVGAGFRFARNAAIGLALLATVPFAFVAIRARAPVPYMVPQSRARIAESERLRPLMGAKDASITPMEAGLAFRALESPTQSKSELAVADEFPLRQVPSSDERPWKKAKLTPAMFADRGPMVLGPSANRVIAAVRTGFTADEMNYLRSVAEAPLWNDFDKVGSAERVDLLGGRFVTPFKPDVFALDMPIMRFADTRALADAGVSRAAYYLANGQTAKAEAALRSVISFGFALIDNSSNTLDALIGRVIVGTGRDGMRQLYLVTNRSFPAEFDVVKSPSATSNAGGRAKLAPDEVRRHLLEDATDASLTPGLRYESLSQLSLGSCSSVRGMLFGPDAGVRDAFDRAGTTLARFPSEKAYLDLMYEASGRVPETMGARWAPEKFVVGAAVVAGAILHNPRIESCTRIAVLSH